MKTLKSIQNNKSPENDGLKKNNILERVRTK